MFTVFQTMTGFHGGLRRRAAAGTLGAMLVLSAGIPVANAAGPAPQDTCFLLICSPSPPETAEPAPTQPAPGPTSPSEAPGTPSNPSPAPAPAVPSGPAPAEETVAPSHAPSPNPSAPDSSLDGDDPGASSTDTNSNAQQVQATGGVGPAGQGIAPASGAKDNGATSSRHLEQASLVHQGKGNASVWWGIVALAVAGIALVIFFRLRRTEKLLAKSP